MEKTLKTQILELRSQGLSYNEISAKLECSKSTISYHLSDEQKEKNANRQRNLRKLNPVDKKISEFKHGFTYKQRHSLNSRIIKFHCPLGKNSKGSNISKSFNSQDLLSTRDNTCYLTGRPIDLKDPTSYRLDHIVPKSKGGPSTLENCGLTCAQANAAKSDMTLTEFFQLCVDVVKHNKLKIE